MCIRDSYNADSPNLGGEFIEFHNRGPDSVNIGNWVVTDAVEYTFPGGTTIPSGGYLVLARDAVAAASFYGVPIHGQYTGRLDNDTDSIVLRDDGIPRQVIDTVTYEDQAPWPLESDGLGASLELVDPFANNNDSSSWWVGDLFTPGDANVPVSPGSLSEVQDIVISEIMYRPRRQEERVEYDTVTAVAGPYMEEGDDELGEYVEIVNRSAFTVDLSGWSFTDGFAYTFPDPTFLSAGDYLVVCADIHALRQRFGIVDAHGPFETGTLSDGGERITLRDDNGEVVDSLVYDAVSYTHLTLPTKA